MLARESIGSRFGLSRRPARACSRTEILDHPAPTRIAAACREVVLFNRDREIDAGAAWQFAPSLRGAPGFQKERSAVLTYGHGDQFFTDRWWTGDLCVEHCKRGSRVSTS